jgi:hypothetical protein
MADPTPIPPPIPPKDVSPAGKSHTRRIPPLVWVILALVVLVLGIGLSGGFGMNHADKAKAVSAAAPP